MQDETQSGSSGVTAGEILSGPQFLSLLRQVVVFREQPKVNDPLKHVIEQITRSPYLSQSRLLMRILVAVTSGDGSFRRAELAALDATTYALVIGLMDVRAVGSSPDAEWAHAVVTAQAAAA